ncbi:MAG: hypothetical protein QM715_17675 [Nibricoccus sp.]
MKVLLIENDPLARLYMEASLATLGLVSEIAESVDEASPRDHGDVRYPSDRVRLDDARSVRP